MLDVNENHVQDKRYFGAIKKQMDSGGREALLYYLMQINLEDFDVRTAPKTKALLEQKLLSLPSLSEWWLNKLTDGRLAPDHPDWKGEVPKDVLVSDYLEYSKNIGIGRRSTATSLGRFLQKVCPSGFPKSTQRRTDSYSRPYFYVFPTLKECREVYAEKELGGVYDWPEITRFEDTNTEI